MSVISKPRLEAGAAEERQRLGWRVDWSQGVPAIMGFAVIVVLGYSGGGLFPKTWRVTLLALLAVAAASLIARERIAVSRREWGFVGALAALAAWAAVSYYWSSLPNDSLIEAERVLLYAVAALTVVLGTSRASLPGLLFGVLAGATAVSAYALAFFVLLAPPLPDPYQGWHLFEPFGYANAVGIFAVLGMILALGLALWATSGAGRKATLATLVVFVPTLNYTASRGAWVALPIGLAAMLVLGSRVRSRTLLLAVLSVGLLVAMAVALALGSEGGQSLSVLGEHRPTYWRIAWEDVAANPVLGSGAGTFGDFLIHEGSTPYYAHDAHNLYLETLAELGPVGLVLLVAGLAIPLVALRGRREPLVAIAGGVYVAFLLHAGVDWDWEFPPVTLLGLLGAATILVGKRPEGAPELSQGARTTLLVAVALLACLVILRLETSGQLGLRT